MRKRKATVIAVLEHHLGLDQSGIENEQNKVPLTAKAFIRRNQYLIRR